MKREPAEQWMRLARLRRCALCGAERPKGHHVISQQVLKRQCQALGKPYEDYRWDARNLLGLCERHHAAHHSKMAAIPLAIVLHHCPKIVEFARQLDLVWWLSREYPNRPRRHHETASPLASTSRPSHPALRRHDDHA